MTYRVRRPMTARLAPLVLAATAAGAAPALVPATMRAAVIDRFGAPQEITLREVAVPALAPDEVLIALDTAGVAVWDAEIRQGGMRNLRLPVILGTDGAGSVAAVGSRVRGFDVGDAVYSYSWANPKGGFYAEYVAVAAKRVARVPKGVDLLRAGAMGTTALTAIQGIDDALHVSRGQNVVILGGSGGVGTLAIQFAKHRGARVLATASGADGLALVRRLGADVAFDSRQGDLAAALREFAPRGADAVLALVGGEGLEASAQALSTGGRLAYPEGVQPEPPKSARIISYNATPGAAQYARLNRAIEGMKFEIPIAGEFPLADAAKAHERLAAGHVLGKLVLRVRQ
jgi:NADPH:quinone reductase-like Zn-dependent oxidoreductase